MAQNPEEELAEWRMLKSWLMDYPHDDDQASINESIHNAPARQVVKHILDEFQRLKEIAYGNKK